MRHLVIAVVAASAIYFTGTSEVQAKGCILRGVGRVVTAPVRVVRKAGKAIRARARKCK